MSPNLSLLSNEKKFMWDGIPYATREDAAAAEDSYRKNDFETCVLEEDGKFLVYTRKVVKEVVISAH